MYVHFHDQTSSTLRDYLQESSASAVDLSTIAPVRQISEREAESHVEAQ